VGVRLFWDGDMRFVAENETGAKVMVDTGPAFGGSGKFATPMELLAMALGGCTGIDMVLILKKMRVNLKELRIEIETKRRQKEPRYYEEIHMTYLLSGDGLTEEQAERAAHLSNEKYCSVGIMLEDKAKISYSIKIE
jgi:putative redox protein